MNDVIATTVASSAQDPLLLAVVAFLAAAAEALVMVGAVVPGTAILLALAALAGAQGSASFAFTVLAAATLGAIAGDSSGYWLGRHYGRGLFGFWPLSRFPDWLPRGETYFDRHGGKSVFWGRFIPGVKTIVPVVAGITHMPPARFLAANVASAALWSLAVVLSGLGVGRGLDRFGLADRRVVVLLAVLLAALFIAYVLLRLLLVRGLPMLERLWEWAIRRLAVRPGRASAAATRLLTNERGALIALVWALISAAAALGLLALLGQLLFDARFVRADEVVSNAVQSLRFRNLDAVMIAVTLAGDGVVLTATATAVLAWLLALRQWIAAGTAAVAFLATLMFVPFLDLVLARERPSPVPYDADVSGLASGQASHAMVVFGVTAILLGHHLGVRARLAVHFAAIGLALTIALSRVYLGASWPSDAAGGVLFGSAVGTALAFTLHDQPLAVRPARMALALALVFGAAYGLHAERGYTRWAQVQAAEAEPAEMSVEDWRAGGWTALPPERIAVGEGWPIPFVAQIAGDPDAVAQALEPSGWRVQDATPTQRILSALLPYGGLDALPAAMVLHDGRQPAAVLVKPTSPGRRLVLRLWPSDMVLADGSGRPEPIALAGLAAELFTPVALGFGDFDRTLPTAAEAQALRETLAAAPGLVPAAPSGPAPDPDPPLLLRVAPP